MTSHRIVPAGAGGPTRGGTGEVLAGEGLVKRFDARPALDRVSLRVGRGRVLAVVGPSGCGKTTVLRALAGLERLDAGVVRVAGRDVTSLPAHRRPIGMVFQDHALFPHLDVAANVAFGLAEAGWSRHDQRARVEELLEDLGLGGLGDRSVDRLSGGERQRVALARALAPKPRVLLLDEPLASLDRHLRERLALDLGRRLRVGELASVFVTHDQDEAVAVGDELAVMRSGRIVQSGPVASVPSQPSDTWVARFLGHRNVYVGAVAARLPRGAETGAVLLREGRVGLQLDDGPPPVMTGASRHRAELRTVLRDRLGLALELAVPELGIVAWWRGAARELDRTPARGEPAVLSVPDDAWWPLALAADDDEVAAPPPGGRA